MTQVSIAGAHGEMPAYVAVPAGGAPWPGIVVVHDALGMSGDLQRQADWLAGEGFLAAAPDLYYWGRRLTCFRTVVRDVARGHGGAFDDLDAVRSWLVRHRECTGTTGVIGFCMGGGFAVLLAPGHGYSAASVNYGGLPKDVDAFLAGACPIVASYGAKDRTLRGAAERLERALARNGVAHDVKEYPDAGHAFLNDHRDADVPKVMTVIAWLTRSEYHEPSALDARRRIVDFFRVHLA